MAPTERHDPLTVFCFKVSIDSIAAESDGAVAFFRSVGGLKMESEMVKHKEGGRNHAVRQLVGPTTWANIVLKRGFTGDPTFVKWRESWLKEDSAVLTRVSGTITQLDSSCGAAKVKWRFHRGWPIRWEGPAFDASKSEVSIETIEIAHEGLYLES